MVTSSKKRPEVKVRKKTTSSKPPASAPSTTANSNGSSPSNGDALRKLYASLLECRLLQEHIRLLPASHAIAGRYELAIGHEAVTVGATADLREEDTITAARSNLAALIARRMAVGHLLRASESPQICGCLVGLAPLTSSSVPADPFHAGTGIALAHKLEKQQNVVIALWSEESASLEHWRDALHIAAVQKLPIIYVMRSAKAEEASSSQATWLDDFSFYIKDYGFPSISVDGRDVVAVMRVAQESIHRARNGSGPTLIDCRMESGEDPLTHMEHYMRKRSLWDDGWKQQLASQIRAEMEAAAATAGA
ncbi:MAG: thiamine pyrophosphate-dependent enzyme [Candidatus Korobacteraceae bacterium]